MDQDAVARDLGKLIAKAEEAERQRAAMFRRLDEVKAQNSETHGVAKEAMSQVGDLKRHVAEKVDPVIEDYRTLKNRGIGVLAIIALLAGSIGAAGNKLLSTLKGMWP